MRSIYNMMSSRKGSSSKQRRSKSLSLSRKLESLLSNASSSSTKKGSKKRRGGHIGQHEYIRVKDPNSSSYVYYKKVDVVDVTSTDLSKIPVATEATNPVTGG